MANTQKISTKTIKIPNGLANKTLKILSNADSVLKVIDNGKKYINEFESQLKSHELKVSSLKKDYEIIQQLIAKNKNKKAKKFSKKLDKLIKKYHFMVVKFSKQHDVKGKIDLLVKSIEKYI